MKKKVFLKNEIKVDKDCFGLGWYSQNKNSYPKPPNTMTNKQIEIMEKLYTSLLGDMVYEITGLKEDDEYPTKYFFQLSDNSGWIGDYRVDKKLWNNNTEELNK